MALSDSKIKNAKPRDKEYKLSDRDGLYLLIYPSGTKAWRLKYHFAGKEKAISFDKYPQVTLAVARERQFDARKLLSQGIDPGNKKREEKQLAIYKSENTFKAIATQWHETNAPKWTPEHAKMIWRRLENHLFLKIGNRPIHDLKPLDILYILKRLEDEDRNEIVHRVLNHASNIFQYAVIIGRIETNPARELGAAIKPRQTEHFPTIKMDRLPSFLSALENCNTSIQKKIAVKLLLLTLLRTGEFRKSKWAYIDFENKQWKIPAEIMKMKRPHIVPLSDYSIKLLKELHQITGNNDYLFPNNIAGRTPYMDENAINYVIKRRMEYGGIVGHGFRSLGSTILNEHGFNKDAIERQLAHREPNKVRAAYNFAEYMPERIEMMQWWGSFIEQQLHKH